MKKVFAGTFVAAAFAVGAVGAGARRRASRCRSAKDAPKGVTVTGCLKAGETAESYLLSDLKWADKASERGNLGVVTPTAPAATATALNLVGSPSGTKLSDHVGHTVEVTGAIDKADKDMAGAPRPMRRPPRRRSTCAASR